MESKGHRENGPYDTKSWTVRRGLDGLGSGVYDAGSRVYHSVGLLTQCLGAYLGPPIYGNYVVMIVIMMLYRSDDVQGQFQWGA